MGATVTVKLPPRFYEDHRARDCGTTGVVVKDAKTFTQVKLDSVAYDDLYSDADYYSGFSGDDFQWNKGLCLSARATLKRLREVERPEGPTADEWERAQMLAAGYTNRQAWLRGDPIEA